MINIPLRNSFYYPNQMNYMNQNLYYQQLNNQMAFNQMMNCNYIPFQLYQNNFINNQMPFYNNKNIFLMNNNTNKFQMNYLNRIKNPQFFKNNKINSNDEYNGLKNAETSFEEKEVMLQKTKKLSIDSTDSNKSSNTLPDEEMNDLEEKKEEEIQNLKINDLENQNHKKGDDCYNIKGKKGGRRYSNISKVSNCSKCSKSTNYSSEISFQKDVSEEKVGKLTNFGENEIKNKNEGCPVEKYQGNPDFENTVILNVNVKISKDKTAVFKLKRYDDLFLTIKLFCEINSIDEKLIKPLIIKSLSTLNTIYQVMNSKLNNEQINLLKKVKNI